MNKVRVREKQQFLINQFKNALIQSDKEKDSFGSLSHFIAFNQEADKHFEQCSSYYALPLKPVNRVDTLMRQCKAQLDRHRKGTPPPYKPTSWRNFIEIEFSLAPYTKPANDC